MNEIVHILNGDSLYDVFPTSIPGDKIVFREMMMEGPAKGDDLNSLIALRKKYLLDAYKVSNEEYDLFSSEELIKISKIKADAKVYLWFEYDLFCQINMWCVIHILTTLNEVKDIHIVYPGHDDWKGFAVCNQSLFLDQYNRARKFSLEDILHIKRLWAAFTRKKWNILASMSKYSSETLYRQKSTIQTQLDRIPQDGHQGIIHTTISQLMSRYGKQDFTSIFRSFSKNMGRYGMGDLQVKRLVDQL